MGVEYDLYHPARHELFELGKGWFRATTQPATCGVGEWSRWIADGLLSRGWDEYDLVGYTAAVAAKLVAWLDGCTTAVLVDDHSGVYPWPDGAPWPPTTGSRCRSGTE